MRQVVVRGFAADTFVSTSLLNMYAKFGRVEDSCRMFNTMTEHNKVSWTAMISGLTSNGLHSEAFDQFLRMQKEGITPNLYTLISVLKAVGKLGDIAEAQEVFERISEPDTVSWTAIISGYAQHGLVEDALELFKRMEQMGVKANDVTLLCVLFACSHRGMVDEGHYHFHQMEKSYGVVPKMEHYACIVDLLGRVGRLNDAMEFIERMPIEPNEMVWQTLLGACRVHENVDLGEIAAEKILSVTPESSATYVLLSNTYIRTGSYEDGLSLRDLMKDRGVKKEPGCSWISVNGRIHKFYAGDQQHPEKHDIYAKLEELRVKLKSMGYIPDLRYVLQDMNLVEKKGDAWMSLLNRKD